MLQIFVGWTYETKLSPSCLSKDKIIQYLVLKWLLSDTKNEHSIRKLVFYRNAQQYPLQYTIQTGKDGLNSLIIFDAINKSSKSGKKIRIS